MGRKEQEELDVVEEESSESADKMASINEEDNSSLVINIVTDTDTTPRAPTRTAMGNYIVPEGGKPLTCLENAKPGPAEYLPKMDLAKPTAPQYSIVGRPKPMKGNTKCFTPSPFRYNTAGDVNWKKKRLTIRKRLPTLFDLDAKRCKDYKGTYKPENENVGSGPKCKLGKRTNYTVATGYVNNLVQPVDSQGFSAPAPTQYSPKYEYFDTSTKPMLGDVYRNLPRPKAPGPATYNVNKKSDVRAHQFGKRFPDQSSILIEKKKFIPASNKYTLGTCMGKGPAYSMKGKPQEKDIGEGGPGPLTYLIREPVDKIKQVSMCYRGYETEHPLAHFPGPADHDVKDILSTSQPKFSLKDRTKTTYPLSIKDHINDNPGPGTYNAATPIEANDKPKYSMARHVPKINNSKDNPGPASYDVDTGENAPSYSMGRRIPTSKVKKGPGPAEYSPKLPDDNSKKGQYTMTSRPKTINRNVNPVSPNRYAMPEMISGKNKGVSFKSRASPHIYTGFRTAKMEEPMAAC